MSLIATILRAKRVRYTLRSGLHGLHQEFRDVFVMDHSFDLQTFLQQPHHQSADGLRRIVHPSSKHIISSYSTHFYTHKQYNYNDLGEFAMGLAAAERLQPCGSMLTAARGEEGSHDVLLWPEGVILYNLKPVDVKLVGDYIIDKRKSLADLTAMLPKLNSHASVVPLDLTFVMAKVSRSQSVASALRALSLLHAALCSDGQSQEKVQLCVAAETDARHGLAANVMLLPGGDSFESVWSPDQARKIALSHKRLIESAASVK